MFDMYKPVTNSTRRPMLWKQNTVTVCSKNAQNAQGLLQVLALFKETRTTAIACLMKQQHFQSTACGSDGTCVEKVMKTLPETFARQILTDDWKSVEIAGLENAAMPHF